MQKVAREGIEITAPVGSFESLHAAIQGGADAVYFGVERLNMRSRSARNFSLHDLETIVNIARRNRVKTCLTLNIVMYDNELSHMRRIVDSAKANAVDAIIAGDPAVMKYAVQRGMPLHLSTQANVSNLESLRFFARFADVIVLARELTLAQIQAITAAIEKQQIRGPSGELVRIELFVHGALCMAISGKCYLSLHQANHSANRGECLQICRRAYIAQDCDSGAELEVDHEYIMSPKDLMTISFLDRILNAGVTVLKIEGRARSPEYVKTVTQCYSEAVESIAAGTFTEDKIENWQERLKTVFNRGFWDGYYLGQRLGEWSKTYGSRATRRRVYIGKGINYYRKSGIAEFIIETKSLQAGDRILVTGPTTGVIETVVDEIWVADQPVQTAVKGDRMTIAFPNVIRPSDKLYKLIDGIN